MDIKVILDENKAFKGRVVNRTCQSIYSRYLKIMLTISLFFKTYFMVLAAEAAQTRARQIRAIMDFILIRVFLNKKIYFLKIVDKILCCFCEDLRVSTDFIG